MTPFKVMTFNIKGSYYEDGENNWSYRAGLNSDLINRFAPDLIGFQEVQQGNIDHYDQTLAGYDYELGAETARENQSGHAYYCAIYWKRDRFDCLDQGYFFLNETPDQYALDWGVTQGRTVNWVKLYDKNIGRRLLHINSHLPHDSEQGRINSAHLIVRCLPPLIEDDDVVLMTADFNARAYPLPQEWIAHLPPAQQALVQNHEHFAYGNDVYRIFQAAGFRDAFCEAGHEDQPVKNTFHGLMGDHFPQIGYRIDWILIKDVRISLRVHDATIIQDAQPPLYPSDHYPVMAMLE
jgi:endonuclease/exonuclease/phosphatase family metal-dependent hydrolase